MIAPRMAVLSMMYQQELYQRCRRRGNRFIGRAPEAAAPRPRAPRYVVSTGSRLSATSPVRAEVAVCQSSTESRRPLFSAPNRRRARRKWRSDVNCSPINFRFAFDDLRRHRGAVVFRITPREGYPVPRTSAGPAKPQLSASEHGAVAVIEQVSSKSAVLAHTVILVRLGRTGQVYSTRRMRWSVPELAPVKMDSWLTPVTD